MKRSTVNLLTFFVLLLVVSCSTDSREPENKVAQKIAITGRWVLIKSEDSGSRKTNHQNQPSDVVLNIQKNGFFIIYDTFVDPKWRKRGLPLIQERSSGQWTLKDSLFTMIHDDKDTSYTEDFKIVRCNGAELVTERSNKKTIVYRTYGKKKE
ncbi:lipocalin family protein [Fluviicola chungangensis]|uniref:Lipocalin-like domain-containing protein n=1 Tax=Fluviicola chungangensis TaxID=2597671 RepID=A0A556N6M3_9FLAO|nr:lipocalin family protein [Fluviicola chungangensis]TSJ47795.1 hypothetical protein FO442_01315 [Fluviicola chungangensis]